MVTLVTVAEISMRLAVELGLPKKSPRLGFRHCRISLNKINIAGLQTVIQHNNIYFERLIFDSNIIKGV